MNKKVIITLCLILLAMIALMYVSFRTLFVKYEHEITSRPSIKAIKNPFLAAERFLIKIGRNVESLSNRSLLITLPSENDLIILNRLGGNLSSDREEALINWIKKGGYLVVTADKIWDKALLKTGNNLLDRFHIRPEIKKGGDYKKESILEIGLGDNKNTAKVSFLTNQFIVQENNITERRYGGNNGDHFLQIGLGKGKLIILSDNNFLMNRNIDDNEHAYFLANLTQNRSKTWLIYSNNMPSLFSLIWENASMFVVCLAVLVLLCILRLNLKSGPMLPEINNNRRNLMEHLEASGNYLFKLNRGKEMLEINQKSTERFLKEKMFFTSTATNSEKSSAIEKKVNLPAEIIHYSLFKSEIEDEQDFINKSEVLQYLANGYTDGLDDKGLIIKGRLK